MAIKTEPIEIWAEYQKGIEYNHSINLYEENVRNENFYNGKQWEGVNAPDLDKPVFNILKRVCNMQMAYIVSDDIGVSLKPFIDDGTCDEDMKILSREIERVIEYTQIKKKNRRVLRDGFVQGDGCMHLFFDTSIRTGTAAKGDISAETLDITNFFFGNPADNEVQAQPYIIVLMRRYIDDVIAEAVKYGMNEEAARSLIVPDSDTNMHNEDIGGNDLVSVLVKYWKKDGNVWSSVTTQNATIRRAFDTGMRLYPIAFMNWEEVKNRYHGQSAVAALLPNQIFINKGFAMHMEHYKKLAFPKLIYDGGRFPNGFTNRVGDAIKVSGPVNDAITAAFKMPDLDGSFLAFIEKTFQYTQETLGASDAALGNIRPDNASAIVATQNATTAPLELVRANFYQFVEDTVRIIIDMMRAYYGERDVIVEKTMTNPDDGAEEKVRERISFDFKKLNDYALNLEINIGSSAYWSEIMQMQTAGNFLAAGIITDAEMYLESIPDKYVANKQKLLETIREQKKAAATNPTTATPTATPDVQQLAQMQSAVPGMEMPEMM